MEFFEVWDAIVESGIATEEELGLVTALMGRHLNALNDVVYIRTGYQSYEQFEEAERESEREF